MKLPGQTKGVVLPTKGVVLPTNGLVLPTKGEVLPTAQLPRIGLIGPHKGGK